MNFPTDGALNMVLRAIFYQILSAVSFLVHQKRKAKKWMNFLTTLLTNLANRLQLRVVVNFPTNLALSTLFSLCC